MELKINQVITDVPTYIAFDGTEFTNENKCKEYEKRIVVENKWAEYIKNKIYKINIYEPDTETHKQKEFVCIDTESDCDMFKNYLIEYKRIPSKMFTLFTYKYYKQIEDYIGKVITYTYEANDYCDSLYFESVDEIVESLFESMKECTNCIAELQDSITKMCKISKIDNTYTNKNLVYILPCPLNSIVYKIDFEYTCDSPHCPYGYRCIENCAECEYAYNKSKIVQKHFTLELANKIGHTCFLTEDEAIKKLDEIKSKNIVTKILLKEVNKNEI